VILYSQFRCKLTNMMMMLSCDSYDIATVVMIWCDVFHDQAFDTVMIVIICCH